MSTVLAALCEAEVLPGQALQGLQVFGLKRPANSPLVYRTLDEAIGAGQLEVSEVSEGGSVPTLQVRNHSDSRVFLMAGEHLVGAKQNRVLNTSLLIEARAAVPIPVSCVEQGRWSYRSAKFASHGTTSHSNLRKKMTTSVTESYTKTAMPRSDQGEVWSEVSRKLGSMGSVSASQAMEQVYEDHRGRLDEYTRQFASPAGCAGAVFVIHGRIAGVDLFDQPATLQKLWPKLLQGYAIDALEQSPGSSPELTAEAVGQWLKSAAGVEPSRFPSPGLGEDLRFKSAQVTGSTLLVEAQPLHVQLFAETPA